MASTWKMDGRQLLKLGRAIKDFSEKQYPIVNGMALNRTAFETRTEYVRIVKGRFTLRNKGTVKSIQFRKARGFNPNTQESSVGSTAQYMADQEFGAIKKATGTKGVAIPTTSASNESLSARPRKKVVSRPRRRSSIRLTKSTVKARSRKQHIFLTIRAAAEKGSGTFVYLPILGKKGDAKGIYRITGKGKKAKIRLIYSLSKKTLPIKKAPTLLPAVNNIIPKMPGFWKEAAEKRMKKTFNF